MAIPGPDDLIAVAIGVCPYEEGAGRGAIPSLFPPIVPVTATAAAAPPTASSSFQRSSDETAAIAPILAAPGVLHNRPGIPVQHALASASTYVQRITASGFEPAELTLAEGDMVVWHNDTDATVVLDILWLLD